MKKIFFIILLGTIITSCDPNENKTKDIFTQDVIPWSSATEYTYKGHSYIKFKESEGYDGYAGVVHNPDCKCFKDSIK